MARLISDVHAGKLPPKVAAGLAPLLNLQLRTIAIVKELEKQAAEAEAKQDLEDGRNAKDLTDAELEQIIRDSTAKIPRDTNEIAQQQSGKGIRLG